MAPIKVLIVEDEAIIALDIQCALERAGYEVTGIATSGDDAAASLHAKRPDVMVMDIAIEGGREGIRLARGLIRDYGVPLILLADMIDTPIAHEASRTAVHGLVIKPFGTSELLDTLNRALGSNRIQ